MSIPHYEDISESIANLLKSVNVFTAFKPQSRIKNFLLNFKPSVPFLDRIGIVYNIPCKECDSVYFGETSRTGTIRIKEH